MKKYHWLILFFHLGRKRKWEETFWKQDWALEVENELNEFISNQKFQINNFKMSRREVQFRVLLDERMDLTYPNIGVLAFLTNFWRYIIIQGKHDVVVMIKQQQSTSFSRPSKTFIFRSEEWPHKIRINRGNQVIITLF